MKRKNLALFFTRGMSLKEWHEIGMLEREVAPYNLLADYFDKIYFFTYGGKDDLKFKKYLKPNIKIVYNYHNINNNLYSLMLPFLNSNIIRKCNILKTNQMDGAWSVFLSKFFNPKAKFILRTGYTLSLFLKKSKNNFKYNLFSLIELILYNLCDRAFVTSKNSFNYITKKYNLKKNKVKLIPNYIDTDIFKPIKKKKIKDRIIFVGRINEVKNLFNLIKSLKDTNIGIDFIGKGELKEKIKSYAQKQKVDIKFIGSVPNPKIPDYLNKYSVYILSSFHEGMPKTLIEAMSCGLACIGTDVQGINEVIADNKTGLLTKCDSKSLRKVILRLMKDKKLQNKLGKNARQFILDNFSLKKMIKKEIEIYENL